MTGRWLAAGVMVVAAALCAPTASAGLDVSFGAAVNVNDDTSLYFAVSSRYFAREPRVVEQWSRRVADPDDLSVLLFISSRAGRSPDAVFALRQAGLSWWDVSIRLGVQPDVWFVPVRRDPGPPYGNAYGYWRKHGKNARAYRVDDRACRDLVAVRMMHEYYGLPVDRAMELRRDGRRVDRLVGGEYRTRHGKGGKEARNQPRAERRHERDGERVRAQEVQTDHGRSERGPGKRGGEKNEKKKGSGKGRG
jgi:hypothetical protein